LCRGELWEIPLNQGTEENNWAITWKFNREEEGTGVYEDKEWIFLHPPRSGLFEILEFCPFPIIKFPLSISKTWDYKLLGTKPFSKAIKQNFGKVINEVESDYTVTRELMWNSYAMQKKIACYEIKAVGHTAIGQTSLQAYFSEVFGFVYMNYETLNNDRFIFVIKSITPVNSSKTKQIWY
jgi:hypothetical protein